MFNCQQFSETPRSGAELAAPSPIENTRRAHIEHACSLPLTRYELLAIHRTKRLDQPRCLEQPYDTL
jgi:hypothetical protein